MGLHDRDDQGVAGEEFELPAQSVAASSNRCVMGITWIFSRGKEAIACWKMVRFAMT